MRALETIYRFACTILLLGNFVSSLNILLVNNHFFNEVLLTDELCVSNFDLFNLFPFFIKHLVIPFTLLGDIIRSEEVFTLLRRFFLFFEQVLNDFNLGLNRLLFALLFFFLRLKRLADKLCRKSASVSIHWDKPH